MNLKINFLNLDSKLNNKARFNKNYFAEILTIDGKKVKKSLRYIKKF